MTQLVLPRRKFLAGAAAFLAAPAIVRASSLMPIKVEREIFFVHHATIFVGFSPRQILWASMQYEDSWCWSSNSKGVEA